MPHTSTKKTNSLINETSPYLLQHAYNPVNWLPFSDKAFEIAKKENKPILISIGYSAYHWCHVMEHESFEDEQVAEIMNNLFVNIKVDREERSDVDMVYMQAVQLMTGHGGWPLNCFVMPDGRPFYGGTYFNKRQWGDLLPKLSELYHKEPEKVNAYATELTGGIKQSELLVNANKESATPDKSTLQNCISKWKTRIDNKEGGPNKAPKFPLPSNYKFLLRYAVLENDQQLLRYVELTLTKMAFGGIYDQVHGGFCRYSTDHLWKVPHFEKMLYDNSQLVSLYCEAFLLTKNELYKEIAIETLSFVEEEWYNKEGFFFSAYDADSDGEEGKYYVWTEADLKELIGKDYSLFSKYYKINETGYWEHDNYILMRSENVSQVLAESGLTKTELAEKVRGWKQILKQEAKSRIKPGLDDKTVTSWNAMMCSAYAKAFMTTGDPKYKEIAIASITFIITKLSKSNGRLYRTYKNGTSKIDGFLEDYAFTIEALMHCYLITQEEKYLKNAREMTALSLELFHNPESEFLFYTSNEAEALIARTTETNDNVIPASNSQMAINLFELGTYFGIEDWRNKAEKMLSKVTEDLKNYGGAYSNWGNLALNFVYPFREVAIVGKNVNENLARLYKHGITNAIFAVSPQPSDLPLIKDRYVAGKDLFYVCENNACKIPVGTVEEALSQLA